MTDTFAARTIGTSGVQVSPLTLGTMRLDRTANLRAAAALLAHAFELGIDTFHCSFEYDTFPLFVEVWRTLPPRHRETAKIIAKVAAPGFQEDRFNASDLRDRIDIYRNSLGLDRVSVVQWLVRFDLAREGERLGIVDQQEDLIGETVSELRRQGQIGAFVSFPYTYAMAEAVIGRDYCDGLAIYVNLLEDELDRSIELASDQGKAIIAIRPLAAGRIFENGGSTVEDALRHTFGFGSVATAVVSASTPDHLDDLRRQFDVAA